MADRTTPITNTLLNADSTPNAGLPVAVTLLVPGNVAAQDATLQVIGTTPLPFVTNAAGTWTGAVIPPGDLTPAGCRYQVTEGSRVTISPSFAYTATPIVVATWYAGPPSFGLILMYLTEFEANALANPGATFSAAISQDAVWSGGAGIGQVIGAGAPPVQLQTNSSGTWQAYFPPSSQLNPSSTYYTIVLDSGISLAFTVPAAYTGDQGAWLVGTTYAANAVVQVAGVPYRSLAGGNVGNAPASSPASWTPYVGEAITGRLTTAIAAGQIAIGAGGIAHSASVAPLIDDPTQAPAFLTDDLANLAGRTSFVRRAVTATATAVATDDYLICDATGAAFAATLMASTARQRPIYVVRVNAGANAVTITPAGADTINGAANLVLTSQWQWAVLKSNGTNGWYAQTGTGGSVTSVALTAPSYITVAGSPITSGGTIALTMAIQNKNLVLASDPTTNAVAPIFRLLAASDMPASVLINPMTVAEDLIKGGTVGAPIRVGVGGNGQVLTVTAGAVGWANSASGFANPMTTPGDLIVGGTAGAATRVGVGGNGQVLTVTAGVIGWAASAAGFANPMTTKGDIIAAIGGGTASRLPVGADGLTILADSTQTLGIKWGASTSVSVTTKGDLQGFSTLAARVPVGADAQVLTADSTQALGIKWAASPAGFANPMTTAGDLIVGGTAGAATRTAIGSVGQVLTVAGGVPVWAAIAVFVASGASHATGLVPDPGSTAGATRFLLENGTWAVPPSAAGNVSVTTKGDLQGYSTIAARIPVGADAQVLIADSTQALGLKWAAPAPGTTAAVAAAGNIAAAASFR